MLPFYARKVLYFDCFHYKFIIKVMKTVEIQVKISQKGFF